MTQIQYFHVRTESVTDFENFKDSSIWNVFCLPNDDFLRHLVFTYIGTEDLSKAVLGAELSGVGFLPLQMNISSNNQHLRSYISPYIRFDIVGAPFLDDFGMYETTYLIVSEHALKILKQFRLEKAEICPVSAAKIDHEIIEFLRKPASKIDQEIIEFLGNPDC